MGVKVGAGINLGGALRAIKAHHSLHQKRHTAHHKQAVAYVTRQKRRAVKGSGMFTWLDDKEKKLKKKYADAKAKAARLVKEKAAQLRRLAAEAKQKAKDAAQAARNRVQSAKEKVTGKVQEVRGRLQSAREKAREKAQEIRGKVQETVRYGRGRARGAARRLRGKWGAVISRGRGSAEAFRYGLISKRTHVKTRLGTIVNAGKDVMARYRKLIELRKNQAKERIAKHFDQARDHVSTVVRQVDKKVGQGIKVGGNLRLAGRRGPKTKSMYI